MIKVSLEKIKAGVNRYLGAGGDLPKMIQNHENPGKGLSVPQVPIVDCMSSRCIPGNSMKEKTENVNTGLAQLSGTLDAQLHLHYLDIATFLSLENQERAQRDVESAFLKKPLVIIANKLALTISKYCLVVFYRKAESDEPIESYTGIKGLDYLDQLGVPLESGVSKQLKRIRA